MNKFKIASVVIGVVLISAIVWFFLPRVTNSRLTQKSFPVKAQDILPSLPVPKAVVSNIGNLANSISSKPQIVFVPRVIDGDTIVVEPVDPATGEPGKQETIRYIGMDTPETVSPVKPVECYGHEASARNKALVDGKYVAIVAGAGNKDKYGRLLRFVYLLNSSSSLGTNVDLELVKEGYARVETIPPNTEFAEEFNAAASSAQAMKLGFWGACATYPFQ